MVTTNSYLRWIINMAVILRHKELDGWSISNQPGSVITPLVVHKNHVEHMGNIEATNLNSR